MAPEEAVTASSFKPVHRPCECSMNYEAILEFGANVVLRAGDGQHTKNESTTVRDVLMAAPIESWMESVPVPRSNQRSMNSLKIVGLSFPLKFEYKVPLPLSGFQPASNSDGRSQGDLSISKLK